MLATRGPLETKTAKDEDSNEKRIERHPDPFNAFFHFTCWPAQYVTSCPNCGEMIGGAGECIEPSADGWRHTLCPVKAIVTGWHLRSGEQRAGRRDMCSAKLADEQLQMRKMVFFCGGLRRRTCSCHRVSRKWINGSGPAEVRLRRRSCATTAQRDVAGVTVEVVE